MSDVKQKALEDMAMRVAVPYFRGPFGSCASAVVDGLMKAGLLHDPEEVARGREALEACVALRRGFSCPPPEYPSHLSPALAVADAELERRKPRPRFEVERGPGNWLVRETLSPSIIRVFAWFADEDTARKYAAQCNAEEAT